jgi:hypothetical protein
MHTDEIVLYTVTSYVREFKSLILPTLGRLTYRIQKMKRQYNVIEVTETIQDIK